MVFTPLTFHIIDDHFSKKINFKYMCIRYIIFLWIYHLYIQGAYIMFIIMLQFNNIFTLKFLTEYNLS